MFGVNDSVDGNKVVVTVVSGNDEIKVPGLFNDKLVHTFMHLA